MPCEVAHNSLTHVIHIFNSHINHLFSLTNMTIEHMI
jgi:hypothetical protein